jgi:arsenate reductase-like glutaredoxin family protein
MAKKITKDELDKIKKIQDDKFEIILRLGQLESNQIILDNEKLQLKEAFNVILHNEDVLLQQLSNNYGDGELNLETGEIV